MLESIGFGFLQSILVAPLSRLGARGLEQEEFAFASNTSNTGSLAGSTSVAQVTYLPLLTTPDASTAKLDHLFLNLLLV